MSLLFVVGVLAALTAPRDGQLNPPSAAERRCVALLGVAVASGLLTYWVFMVSPFALGPPLLILLEAFWRFGSVVGTAYAVLTYQLFDIDVKVRFAIKQSTFAAIVGGVFIVTSETLELLASDRSIAIAIAVGLALLFRMLQRASGMLVQQFIPQAEDATSRAVRRQEVHEAALEGILVDGAVTTKERMVLDALVEKLELDPEEARRLEDDVLLRLAGAA